MRKVTVAEFVSLDGVMDTPKWTIPYWNREIAQFKQAELFASDALLLGRKTYANFAQAWPPRTGADDYADRMNSLPKHVVSTTLQSATWQNATIVNGDVVAAIQQLKAQPGADILVFGSGQLVAYLAQHQLIDEYRLLIYPLVLGRGQRLFPENSRANLTLVESHHFSSGVMAMIYRPA